jgi:Icc-related predicted phosphoesterase
MRIAATGDIHCRVDTKELISQLLGEIQKEADVLVLTGDLTDTGYPEEAEVLLPQLQMLGIPVVATLGNHDHESGKAAEIKHMLREGGVMILDGTVVEIGGVGFAGTKGFCGGFGENLVQPFGEEALKTFIHTGIDEAIALENALARLTTCRHRVAVLHYAPIKGTLIGESPEIYAFLGSSRLANAIDRRGVDVIFHGHAHHGCPDGRTAKNIPVHNVSRFVLLNHTGKPYSVVEI